MFGFLLNKKKITTHLDLSNKNFQLLLIESNHRIKNNLQMISSMVNFSSDKISESEKKALNDISSKIQVISALYKQMSIDLRSNCVSLPMYFEDIIHLYTHTKPNELQVEKEIYPLIMDSERIVYFGLILNELITNTLEKNVIKIKKIYISVKKTDNYFVFEYYDYSTQIETEDIGQGILLDQLVKRVKGTNCQLHKKTGIYKFHFKDIN